MYAIDLNQLEFFHPNLRAVLRWIETRFGFLFIITSLYRIGDPGVHGTLPLRAVDLRCRSQILGKGIAETINKHWKYDPDRPEMLVAIFHDTGRGYHLHIQVHPNTYEV